MFPFRSCEHLTDIYIPVDVTMCLPCDRNGYVQYESHPTDDAPAVLTYGLHFGFFVLWLAAKMYSDS